MLPTNPSPACSIDSKGVVRLVTSLCQAATEGDWGIKSEDVTSLLDWNRWPNEIPHGCLLSLRIRFGCGETGVRQTFKVLADWLARACPPKRAVLGRVPGWPRVRDRIAHLSLAVGDETHRPGLEWIVVQPNVNRQRAGQMLDPANLLADEGLALACLYPELVAAIDYEFQPALILGGYRIGSEVIAVERDIDTGGAVLETCSEDDPDSTFSVPIIRPF